MKTFRLLLITLLISGLSALPALAETGILSETDPQAVSPVITAGGSADSGSGLSTATSAPSTVYNSGRYTAGADIPAGEYVLLADSASPYGTYIIYAGGSEDAEYVDYNYFSYNAVIRLEEGQVLELSGCTASPIDEVPKIDHYYGTMYKIGYHIPAGTYQLKALDSSSGGVAYVLSYPSDNYDVVEDYTYVEDTAAITVSDGQYLQLSDCILTGTAPASFVTPNHGRTSDSWYDEWTGAAQVTGDEQRSSLVTAGSLIPGLPTRTSTPTTSWQPGTYRGGTDIPAGEYVLLGNERDTDEYSYSSGCAYMISTVSTPEDMEQITDYGTFYYNSIIRLEEGQFLTLDNCTASPIDQVPDLDYRKASHFKVGYHIPAGTYYFRSDGYGAAYILSAPSQQYKDVVDYETTPLYSDSNTVSLTVQEGQYLFLAGCVFTDSGASAGSPGPGGEATDPTTAAYLDYFKQLYGYEEEEAASPVITAPSGGRALSATTSVPSTVYREGSYEVGTEIPAGDYILLCSGSPNAADDSDDYGSAYVISTTRETEDFDDVIDYNYFSYNAIIRVAEGQFLYLANCTASPVGEVPQLDYSRGEMYQVGLQLPAGTYRLKANADAYSYGRAYILSAPSDNFEDVLESFTVSVGEDTTVTVKNGQYLQLKNCTVTVEVSSDSGSAGPAFAPEEDAQDDPENQDA